MNKRIRRKMKEKREQLNRRKRKNTLTSAVSTSFFSFTSWNMSIEREPQLRVDTLINNQVTYFTQ